MMMHMEQARTDWRQHYLQKYYLGEVGLADEGRRWVELVRQHTPEGARVLEIGGGPVTWTTEVLKEKASTIIGLDVDEVVQTNPLLDQAFVYQGGTFPLPDACVDLVVSRWWNAHVPDPEVHFAEVRRVLAPGGVSVFRTVNLYHYMTIVAYLTPHRVKVPLVKWLMHMSPEDHVPYQTHYRANTR